MSTISASTTTTTAFGVTADTTGALVFQTGATPTTALTLSSGQVMTLPNDATISGLTVGKGGAGGAANTAFGNTAIPIAPNSGVTAIGSHAGAVFNTSSDTGQSTFVGYYAGAQVSTGTDNTFVGGSVGTNTTTGAKNTAIGSQALQLNTTASNNTAVGYQALYSQVGGAGLTNTAVGYTAGRGITTATDCIAIGQALYTNSTGNGNIAIGNGALYLTTGAGNTAIGGGAGYNISSGAKNTIIGAYNGNQGVLDIRTASNYVVLSDGDGNTPVFYKGNTQYRVPTSVSEIISKETVGRTSNPSQNTWYTIWTYDTYDLASFLLLIGYEDDGADGNNRTALFISSGSTYGNGFGVTALSASGIECQRSGNSIQIRQTVNNTSAQSYLRWSLQTIGPAGSAA